MLRLATVLVLLSSSLLGGCAVVAVGSTAVSVAASGVGLAADAAVGTVRLTGKAIGATADLVLPSSN
ncbi:hypothetical protein [uncultured Ramlibacter sp.]|uniref:hypothetical protein n=1 Tax=uncultured Ramlibacter sp. TaxID=260755 RepID=UPI0026292EFA|nr:hypothetical protein [uncultured Ramlibacter sp.]